MCSLTFLHQKARKQGEMYPFSRVLDLLRQAECTGKHNTQTVGNGYVLCELTSSSLDLGLSTEGQ